MRKLIESTGRRGGAVDDAYPQAMRKVAAADEQGPPHPTVANQEGGAQEFSAHAGVANDDGGDSFASSEFARGLSAAAHARVLVIEDEPGIIDFVKRGLEAQGFEVRSATDGTEGERIALSE